MNASGHSGLTSAEAAIRLQRDGPNLLPQPERRRRATIIVNVLREPMLLLLLAATVVYMLLGDPGEAALLGVSVLLVIALTVYQEEKSERALQALRELSTPRARVLRDGSPGLLPASELVAGDVILVAEGDRVPADARVFEENDLHADESLLTGESVPVRRGAVAEGAAEELLHASTLVVRGHGSALVTATGTHTAVGQIGVALRGIQREATPMQREMRRLVVLIASLGASACLLMTGLYVFLRGGWLEALLAGLTLAIAIIPEEFPVVLAVFLALGAWRMAKHQALVRRAPAIEALGSTSVLCTDKTGTLTENRMAVAELAVDGLRANPGAESVLPPALDRLLDTAARASHRQSLDPMERALQEASARMGEPGADAAALVHVREYPLSPACPAVSHVWLPPGGDLRVACKGAPETVAALCRLPATECTGLLAEVDSMARRGLRVLAVAAGSWPRPAASDGAGLPANMGGFSLQWLGLVGFADPLRAGVPEAVAEARAAGIRVIMLTGDHLETARAIARQAGIADHAEVLLGGEFDQSDDALLIQRVAAASVFARVRPEHKLRLVELLKRQGQVVAMTGDGVNDAPALMAAHVGVAMGERGTDVAREAASIVLLDDNFVTVVRAIRLGRSIHDNIRRAVHYILAVHVPIAGLALLPLLSGGPLVLLPLHVVFLELIIDPACSIVFEREPAAADIMQRPPRPPAEPLVGVASLLLSLGHGAVMFASVVIVYLLGTAKALSYAQVGALAFTALVAGNVGLIVLYRSGTSVLDALRRPNPAFWWVVLAALGLLFAVTRFEAPGRWFGFASPPVELWLLALLLPLAIAAVLRSLRRAPGAARRGPAPFLDRGQ
jgi:Ca2+-transporting ATPase